MKKDGTLKVAVLGWINNPAESSNSQKDSKNTTAQLGLYEQNEATLFRRAWMQSGTDLHQLLYMAYVCRASMVHFRKFS